MRFVDWKDVHELSQPNACLDINEREDLSFALLY